MLIVQQQMDELTVSRLNVSAVRHLTQQLALGAKVIECQPALVVIEGAQTEDRWRAIFGGSQSDMQIVFRIAGFFQMLQFLAGEVEDFDLETVLPEWNLPVVTTLGCWAENRLELAFLFAHGVFDYQEIRSSLNRSVEELLSGFVPY